MVHVTKTDGNPIPASAQNLYLSYYVKYHMFTNDLFRSAVNYLAAYRIALRLKSLDKATLADLDSNRTKLSINPDGFLKEYKSILRRIRVPSAGGV